MRNPNYVVGRGKLYFNQFLAGTKTLSGGARYLGNSPEISLGQNEEKLDHYNSDGGINVKDASISLQNDLTGSFTLDDISHENLALWFRGAVQSNVVAGGAVADEAHTVNLGTYVQLGLTDANPIGARNVSLVTATNTTQAAAVVDAAGNFEVDPVTGRVYILEDAPDIADGDELSFSYTAAAGTENVVIAAGTVIEGRLEYFADNAAGANDDYVWPYVQISPDGDLPLKGDDWQSMTFTMEVLKLNDSTERQYIIRRPAAAV